MGCMRDRPQFNMERPALWEGRSCYSGTDPSQEVPPNEDEYGSVPYANDHDQNGFLSTYIGWLEAAATRGILGKAARLY